jgi:hypothetical protein
MDYMIVHATIDEENKKVLHICVYIGLYDRSCNH